MVCLLLGLSIFDATHGASSVVHEDTASCFCPRRVALAACHPTRSHAAPPNYHLIADSLEFVQMSNAAVFHEARFVFVGELQ